MNEAERLLKLKLLMFVVRNQLYYKHLKHEKLPLRVVRAAIKQGHRFTRN